MSTRGLPRVDDSNFPNASRQTSGSMARRHGRLKGQQPTHMSKRQAHLRKKQEQRIEGNIYDDPAREEAIRYQKQVKELKKEQEALLRRVLQGKFRPSTNYPVDPQEITDYNIATAKLEQAKIDREERNIVREREQALQQQRLINMNLKAAEEYRDSVGDISNEPLNPFYYTPRERKNARKAYKYVKQNIFGAYGPFQNRPFTIDVFNSLRIHQLRLISRHIPQGMIQLEIARRLSTAYTAASYINLLPYDSNPTLRLTPQSRILSKLSKDPRYQDLPSVFIKTQHNPYQEFNRSLVPFFANLLREQTIAPTQVSGKTVVQNFKAQNPTTRRQFKQILRHFPMYLRRARLLRSKYRAVRQLVKRYWIYSPPSLDTFNSIKTTPVYFPNSHLASTLLSSSNHTSQDIQSLSTQGLTSSQQAAMLWLEELPFQLDIDLLVTGQSSQPHPITPTFSTTKIYFVPRKLTSRRRKTKNKRQPLFQSIIPQQRFDYLDDNAHTYDNNDNSTSDLIINPIHNLTGEPTGNNPPPFLALASALPPTKSLSSRVTELLTDTTQVLSTLVGNIFLNQQRFSPETR